MAKLTVQDAKTRLGNAGIWYQPTPQYDYDSPKYDFFDQVRKAPLTTEQAAARISAPVADLQSLVSADAANEYGFESSAGDASVGGIGRYSPDLPSLRFSDEESNAYWTKLGLPRGGGGGFFSLLTGIADGFIDVGKGLLSGVSETVNAVADPVANALGVHPDVVKTAAAALGMYYAPGVGFTDAAGAAVSDAAAAEMIAAYGADALTAAGQMEAAATLSAAAPAAAVASPVATSPLAPMGGPNILMDFPANMVDTSLGQSYNALGVGAGAPAAAGAVGAANALSAADLAALDAGLGGVSSTATGTNALAAGAGAAFDPASALETQLAATGTGAGAAAAGAGAGTISGYGGAGDVLDPVTGAVISGADAAAITGAGFNLSDFAKFAKDYGVPLSALISGITGSRAATNAAEIQAQSGREARQLARDIFNEQKALQEPYRAAGITAQNQLLNLLGLSGATSAPEYGKFARPFGMSDFQADPGYAFRLSEGMKALEASRAARGGLLSGATGKALTRYGQEMGAQEYGNAFNRYQTERANRLNPLAGLMTAGQAAASGQAANAGTYGQIAGGLTTDIGAAQAAGGIGSANAITNAMNQFARYSAAQNYMAQPRQSIYAPALGY